MSTLPELRHCYSVWFYVRCCGFEPGRASDVAQSTFIDCVYAFLGDKYYSHSMQYVSLDLDHHCWASLFFVVLFTTFSPIPWRLPHFSDPLKCLSVLGLLFHFHPFMLLFYFCLWSFRLLLFLPELFILGLLYLLLVLLSVSNFTSFCTTLADTFYLPAILFLLLLPVLVSDLLSNSFCVLLFGCYSLHLFCSPTLVIFFFHFLCSV